MNTCLKKYEPIKKVWHIGGWSFDLNRVSKYDIFRKICSLGDGLHGKADGSILKKIQKN